MPVKSLVFVVPFFNAQMEKLVTSIFPTKSNNIRYRDIKLVTEAFKIQSLQTILIPQSWTLCERVTWRLLRATRSSKSLTRKEKEQQKWYRIPEWIIGVFSDELFHLKNKDSGILGSEGCKTKLVDKTDSW